MLTLYSYWRSSAAYRVRIGLHLKGVDFDQIPVSLIDGAHREADYVAVNRQQVLPSLKLDDGTLLTQSIAILEFLDETVEGGPSLLPPDPVERARARAFAAVIASDTHPIQNLRVLKYLRGGFAAGDEAVSAWAREWIVRGFAALEPAAAKRSGAFMFGDAPGLAECCLVPQVYNARRFGVDMGAFPRSPPSTPTVWRWLLSSARRRRLSRTRRDRGPRRRRGSCPQPPSHRLTLAALRPGETASRLPMLLSGR